MKIELEHLSTRKRNTQLAGFAAGVLPTSRLVGLRSIDGLVWHVGHALLYRAALIHHASMAERRNPTHPRKFDCWTRARQHTRAYRTGELCG